MKTVFGLAILLGLGLTMGWIFHDVRVNAQGGGGEGCATMNGDVNADGTLDQSDAIVILTKAFLNPAQPISPVCPQSQAAGLPDTGQTKCYDRAGAEIDCASVTCPGQDGFYATGCPNSVDRFVVDNQLGTVTDTCTGLMWQKDMADVNGDGQSTDQDYLPWCAALSYCENLSFAGHDDWRLPNVRELQSIVDYGRFGPAIDPKFGAFSAAYWSSTTYVLFPGFVWFVDFPFGIVRSIGRDSYRYVRAVRSGP